MFKWPKLYQTSFCHTITWAAYPLLVLITWPAPHPYTHCSDFKGMWKRASRARKDSIQLRWSFRFSWSSAGVAGVHGAYMCLTLTHSLLSTRRGKCQGSGSLLRICTVKVSSSSLSTAVTGTRPWNRFSSLLCNRLSLFCSRQLGCHVPLLRLSVTQTVVRIYLQYVLCHFDYYFVWLVE